MDMNEQKDLENSIEKEMDERWQAMSYDDKLMAFYSVVKRIYQGEIVQQCSYRYVLYDIFEFGPESYGLGMQCGFLSLHNSILSPQEVQKTYALEKENLELKQALLEKDAFIDKAFLAHSNLDLDIEALDRE